MRTKLMLVIGWLSVGCAVPAEDSTRGQSEPLATPAASPSDAMHERAVTSQTHAALGVDPVCAIPPGWIVTSASAGSLSAPTFSPEIASMIDASHPFSIGVSDSAATGEWSMRASGTLTDQWGDQYFPPDHPADPTGVSIAAASLASLGAETTAWMRFVDAKSAMIWVPLSDVVVSGQFPTGCHDVLTGDLDAVVQASAASVVVTTSQGDVMLGDVFGGFDSADPPGWRIHVAFEAHAGPVRPD